MNTQPETNLLLNKKGYPNVPDVKVLERKISELENLLRAARIDAENNRSDATLYRHVRTLTANQFSSIYTRNISGHGKFDDLMLNSLRKSMEGK